MDCEKKYPKIKDENKVVKDIEKFCSLLKANKVKDSKEAFLNLPLLVQCLFLHHSWNILSKKSKHSEDSYLAAFYIFKLFRGKDMKEKEIYSRYDKLKTLEKFYKSAVEWNKKEGKSITGKSKSVSKSSKKYAKEYQKHPEITDENDPLYIFYTTLLAEKPNSVLAISWLTEHGIFDGKKRESIVKKYEQIKKK
jgi:hypothetical protein